MESMALVKRSLSNTLCRVKGFRGASSQDTRRQFLNDSSWAESIRCCYLNSSHIGGEESVNVHCTYWVVNNTQRLASNADLYLGGRGGLQAVKAERSTERPLVKVGQVACLQEIKAPHETSRWRRRTSPPPVRVPTCSEKSFPSMSSLLECPPGLCTSIP